MIQIFCGNRYGVNLLELEEALDDAVSQFLGDRREDPYAREVIFADDTQNSLPPLERLLQALQGGDLFGGGAKAVILRSFDAMKDPDVFELQQVLKRGIGENALFIEGLKFFRESKKGKAKAGEIDWDFFKNKAKVFEFPNVPEWEIVKWVENRAKKHGYLLRRENALFFVETVGSDTQTIESEFGKLKLYAQNSKELSYEILDAALSRSSESSFQDIQKQFGLANRKDFLQQLDHFSTDRSEWMGLLSSLFYHSSTLLRTLELKTEGHQGDALATAVGMSPFAFKSRDILRQCQSRNIATWKKVLLRLGESTQDIVAGHLSQRADLELRLLSLFPASRN